MGLDLKGLVDNLVQVGALSRIVNDPRAQFGVPARKYLGATLLPEKQVPLNDYTEEGIQYRTIIANAGTRYSPVQKKGGMLAGSFRVSLGNSDTGNEITGSDYDGLIRLIEASTAQPATMAQGVARPDFASIARGQIFNWVDLTLSRPLLEHNEYNRWQAIVNASIVLNGDNGYTETVTLPNPSGTRVSAGGVWSNNSYDPYADIMAGAEFLAAKGYTVNRIITSTPVRSKLTLNTKILQRVGRLSVNASNNVVNNPAGRATLARLNELLSEDGLPPIELYDLQYRTNTSSGYFLPRAVFVMIATTGRDMSIDFGDIQPFPEPGLTNTLGYTAIGRSAGQNGPGRVVKSKVVDDTKPPRVQGEAWQTSLPVITDPEAIFVINTIS